MADEIRRNYRPFAQYGRISQRRYAGVFNEEFLEQLSGRKGIETYREMSQNDSVIAAMLFAIEMLVRQVKFDVEQVSDDEADVACAKFIKDCIADMRYTWQDTLSEILSFLIYGWSYHEILYKRRNGRNASPALTSKYSDGLIGWQGFPIRAQDSFWNWEYDENDELLGLTQFTSPDFTQHFIPLGKSLHFITKSRKGNPEGVSILRTCYCDWYYKKRLQQIEGVGVERDLAGLPMVQPPEGIDIWNGSEEANRALIMATELVQNVRRDALEGIVIPYGWTFSLLNSGSRRQFEIGSIIERYDKRMAMSVMADFIFLGSAPNGSYALSSDKTELFAVALGTYLDIICDVMNTQAIPRLIDLNGKAFDKITDYPRFVHGDVEKPNLTDMGGFIEKMIGVGLLTPDEGLEKYVRRLGELPEIVEADPDARSAPKPGTKRGDGDSA